MSLLFLSFYAHRICATAILMPIEMNRLKVCFKPLFVVFSFVHVVVVLHAEFCSFLTFMGLTKGKALKWPGLKEFLIII